MTTKSDGRKNIIVVAGPTGSGKTELAVALAAEFSTAVVSADSRQMYKGMAIGTAQPSPQQLSQAEHYLIASHRPEDQFTAGRYEREALSILGKLFREKEVVVVAGGTGLYIDALCNGMDDIPDSDPSIRHDLEKRLTESGLGSLVEELEKLDPDYYARADVKNPRRVIRALEVCRQTGKPFSSFRLGGAAKRDFGMIKIGTILPREKLYARIDDRVDRMLEAGLEQEARNLYPLRHLNSLQTVGYRELFDYFDGAITYAKAVELIKRNSRRYAKRQLTWFSRDETIKWFSPYATDEAVRYVRQRLEDTDN